MKEEIISAINAVMTARNAVLEKQVSLHTKPRHQLDVIMGSKLAGESARLLDMVIKLGNVRRRIEKIERDLR